MNERKDVSGVLVLPPILFFGGLLLGVLLHYVWPFPLPIPAAVRWIAGIVAAAGVAFGGAGRRAFAIAGTEANPTKPSTVFVSSGPFRFTRNPMYVGMSIAFLGIAIATSIGWLVLLWLAIVALMHWGVILREERYLSRKFGAPYDDYCRRVRRYF